MHFWYRSLEVVKPASNVSHTFCQKSVEGHGRRTFLLLAYQFSPCQQVYSLTGIRAHFFRTLVCPEDQRRHPALQIEHLLNARTFHSQKPLLDQMGHSPKVILINPLSLYIYRDSSCKFCYSREPQIIQRPSLVLHSVKRITFMFNFSEGSIHKELTSSKQKN